MIQLYHSYIKFIYPLDNLGKTSFAKKKQYPQYDTKLHMLEIWGVWMSPTEG